jgi:hypothetical protein
MRRDDVLVYDGRDVTRRERVEIEFGADRELMGH